MRLHRYGDPSTALRKASIRRPYNSECNSFTPATLGRIHQLAASKEKFPCHSFQGNLEEEYRILKSAPHTYEDVVGTHGVC